MREENNILREQVRSVMDEHKNDERQTSSDRARLKELFHQLNQTEERNEFLTNENLQMKVELANKRSGEGSGDGDSGSLKEQVEQLTEQLKLAEREIENLQIENNALHLSMEEQRVQIDAQHRFEIDYDEQVSN